MGATVGVLVPRLHRVNYGYDAANVSTQEAFTGSLAGCAVGTAAGITVLHFHKKLHGTGISAVPKQGLNRNGYAYWGLLMTRCW